MSKTRTRARLSILSGLGVLMLAGTMFQAGIANAATYSGKWSLSAAISAATNSRMYTTNRTHKVSTCVSVTNHQGMVGGSWSFELIWFDGGKNKVLWHSGDYEGNVRKCSPVKRPGGNDKVYDRFILFNDGTGAEVKVSGKYTINTY